MQTATKKPTATFVVRMVATGLRPWDVPWRVLMRIINAVQRLIEHEEPPELGSDEDETEGLRLDAPIQLLDVIMGSAAYAVAARNVQDAIRILTDTGKNLKNPSHADWDSVSLSSIEQISAAAKTIGCTVEIRDGTKRGQVIAKITPESYAEISEGAFIKGQGSIYGYLERVGGATRPHCGLRIAEQISKMLICHVASEDLVRKLGPYVYKNVHVFGEVTWLKSNWRVKTINVQDFEPVKTGSIREALNEIYEAGGKAWDDIADPEALIKGER